MARATRKAATATPPPPLLELTGALRLVPITSERGARWLVLTIDGINVADAVQACGADRGDESVRLTIAPETR